jgi:hypothetical protein
MRVDPAGVDLECDAPTIGECGSLGNGLLLDGEKELEKGQIRFYPEMTLAEGDVVGDGEYVVGGDVVMLELVSLEDFQEEITRRQR